MTRCRGRQVPWARSVGAATTVGSATVAVALRQHWRLSGGVLVDKPVVECSQV